MSSGLVYRLGVYLHLAQASRRAQRPMMQYRMLVMAATIATELRLHSIAAYCRDEVLQNNPKHILRRWSTVVAAMDDDDFVTFLNQMRRKYPPEKAERMLDSMGFVMACERETYYTDAEYAAAILGTSVVELERRFS